MPAMNAVKKLSKTKGFTSVKQVSDAHVSVWTRELVWRACVALCSAENR